MSARATRGKGAPAGLRAGLGALVALTACALVLVWRMTSSGSAPVTVGPSPAPPSAQETPVSAAAAPGPAGIAPRVEGRAEPILAPSPASAPPALASATAATASPASISEATDAMQRRVWRLLERCGTILEGAPVSWEVKLRFDAEGREVGREAKLAAPAEAAGTLTRTAIGGDHQDALARCLAAADDEPVTISPPGAATEVALSLKIP